MQLGIFNIASYVTSISITLAIHLLALKQTLQSADIIRLQERQLTSYSWHWNIHVKIWGGSPPVWFTHNVVWLGKSTLLDMCILIMWHLIDTDTLWTSSHKVPRKDGHVELQTGPRLPTLYQKRCSHTFRLLECTWVHSIQLLVWPQHVSTLESTFMKHSGWMVGDL